MDDFDIDKWLEEAQSEAATLSRTTPLQKACANLDEETALALIAEGGDVGAADKFGRTPLHEVARNAYEDEPKAIRIATALLDAGHPIDPSEKVQGETPLFLAAVYRAPELLKLLIARGANVNHKMKDRNTPLGALTATTSLMRGRSKVIKILEAAGGTGRRDAKKKEGKG